MLSAFLAISVLLSAITTDASGIIKEQSAFFASEVSVDGAKVVALKTLSSSALKAACRRALTLPQRMSIRSELAVLTAKNIPQHLSFIDANITGYRQTPFENGVNCVGKVSVVDASYNQAGLALITAWWAAEQGDMKLLRAMLKVSLQHARTQADSVALIASQTDSKSGLAYLDKHLHPAELTLDHAKLAVGQIWLDSKKFEAVIGLISSCHEPLCQQLLTQAEERLQQIEIEQANDLSSYF
ncbi:hypothetical protein L2729_16205 [Shewanella gelidimarina]|uniref:hypothetical protein n=1 Tax=Shewanella gelidimarina TaxID=56813 RepID=UPI00200EF5A9|nr:hypothetical protein [Shewanella gelidimarina]MCL1059515.1 hypothetical protein [Shewanella gelidimarina]